MKILFGGLESFSTELEDELQQYLVTMESTFFGLTRKDRPCLAYQMAQFTDGSVVLTI